MQIRTPRQLQAAARARRRMLGLTQQAVADRAGLSRKWVSEFERGKASVELDPVLRLLDALDLWMNIDSPSGHTHPPTTEGPRSNRHIVSANSVDDVDLDAHLKGLLDR
jgi:HTH-type transcriptional regulator/antitoxin HipB